jgi:hypothetical protein
MMALSLIQFNPKGGKRRKKTPTLKTSGFLGKKTMDM